jgi:cell division septation protein DedD
MPRGRHASPHSRSAVAVSRRPRRIGPGRYGWLALAAAFSLLVGTAVRYTAGSYHGTAAISVPSAPGCAAAPRLAADTSAETLFGASASSPASLARATAQFGHMPIVRVFYPGLPSPRAWATGVPAVNKSAVIVSFNALPGAILSGADDAALSHFFDTAPTGHPVYYSYFHEPEVHIEEGQFTLSAYRAAWARVVSLANAAHNPDLKSTLILTSYDLSPQSGRNWKNYLPAGGIISTLGWDDYPPGTIGDHDPRATPPADFMSAEVAAARSAGLPFGFAEFALATPAGRPGWLAQVGSYVSNSGALFATYFQSPGAGYMSDPGSIAAWRSVVARSGSDVAAPAPAASPSPTTPARATTPAPTRAPSPRPAPGTAPAGLAVTRASVSPAAFAPTGANHVRIRFKLSQRANITVCILNGRGTAVRELHKRGQRAGWPSYWYFGHDTRGRLLAAGRYPVVIMASNAHGSATARTVLTITGRR